MCGVINLTSDRHSEDRHNHQGRPIHTVSTLGEECRSAEHRERRHNHDSEFQRYISQIEPITAFEDPTDGYLQGFSLTYEALDLINQGKQIDNKETILELFAKSYSYFLGVRETAPNWQDQMISSRLEKTKISLREAYFASNTQK
jgi:hypothetical protein